MNKITENEWVNDFHDFIKGDGTTVPKEVSEAILARVRQDLNPSPWIVFSKLLGVHLVVGTLSLGICNQFGLNPFQTRFSLSNYFMKFGNSTCMLLCGVLFLGLSISFSRFLLWPEEFRVVKRSAGLQIFSLSMISLGIFAAFGAQLVFSFAFFWLGGAMLGGMVTILSQRQSA